MVPAVLLLGNTMRWPETVMAPLAAAGVVFGGTPLSDPSSVPPPVGPPSRRTGAGELLAPWQLTRLLAAAPRLALAPRGDRRVVIDIPGWRASDRAGTLLRAYLRQLGYEARGWGLGTNQGRPQHDAGRLAKTVVTLARTQDRPVSLVGWSLGGVIAREIARAHPDHVDRVITFGTPVTGGPTHTFVAGTGGRGEGAWVQARQRRLDAARPITTPITAIYSRADGVVAWRACIDHVNPLVEHVEVRSPHLGLGLDPDVWQLVAARLATSSVRLPR